MTADGHAVEQQVFHRTSGDGSEEGLLQAGDFVRHLGVGVYCGL